MLAWPGVHVEKVRDREAHLLYCQKDETRVDGPWKVGKIPKCTQGKRNDLDVAIDMILNNTPKEDVATSHPKAYIRYFKGLRALRTVTTPERSDYTTVVFIHGEPGTGKTELAKLYASWLCELDENDASSVYYKPRGKWWPGYDSAKHHYVVWDEFGQASKDNEVGRPPIGTLLGLAGDTPLSVEDKGSYKNFTAKVLFITSNFSLNACYGTNSQWGAVARRFHARGRHEPHVEIKMNPGDALNVLRFKTLPLSALRFGPQGWAPATPGGQGFTNPVGNLMSYLEQGSGIDPYADSDDETVARTPPDEEFKCRESVMTPPTLVRTDPPPLYRHCRRIPSVSEMWGDDDEVPIRRQPLKRARPTPMEEALQAQKDAQQVIFLIPSDSDDDTEKDDDVSSVRSAEEW